VWATADNVPALCRLAQYRAYAGHHPAVVAVLARLADPRAAAALAAHLPRRDEGARRGLAAIGAAAEDAVLPYHNDPGGHALARDLLKAYGTKSGQLLHQCVADLKSPEEARQNTAVVYLIDAPDDPQLRPEIARALAPWSSASTSSPGTTTPSSRF
jgi:hypothetical protein